MAHDPYAYLKQVERRIQDPDHDFCRPSSVAAMMRKCRKIRGLPHPDATALPTATDQFHAVPNQPLAQ